MTIRIAAIIVAGGNSSRFGTQNKILSKLPNGHIVIEQVLETFLEISRISKIILVVPKLKSEQFARYAKEEKIYLVEGGERRQDSVLRGLEYIDAMGLVDHVLVHDAARPFVSKDLIHRIIEELDRGQQAVIPVLKCSDTMKLIKDNFVVQTLSREDLVAVQTPQAFAIKLLQTAYSTCDMNKEYTDCSMIVEQYGGQVSVVEGEGENRKITYSDDIG